MMHQQQDSDLVKVDAGVLQYSAGHGNSDLKFIWCYMAVQNQYNMDSPVPS
jgi:hypothetical protein